MAIPTIVIGIALPSHLQRSTWVALGILALIYAVVAWRYPAWKALGHYALLFLAIADIALTTLELRSDLSSPVDGQRAAFAASLTLDAFQFIPAITVGGLIVWQLYKARRRSELTYREGPIVLTIDSPEAHQH